VWPPERPSRTQGGPRAEPARTVDADRHSQQKYASMWIELIKPVGEMKAGEFHDIADETAARGYIAAGLAKDAGDGPDKIILQRALGELRAELSGITRAIAEDVRATATSLRQDRGLNIGGSITPTVAAADRDKGLGDMVRQIVFASDPRDAEAQAAAVERLGKVYESRYVAPQKRAGQNESSGSAGGFTTAAIYESQLMQQAAEDSVFASRAHVVPLGARTTYWPALDQYRTPSAGQSAMFGGVQVYRKSEVAQRTSTGAAFKQIGLTAQDLTVFVPISRDEIYDSTLPIDAKVTELIGGAIGWREDWECFQGTGSGQMLGIYNAPSTILITRNTASTIKYQDVFTMRSRVLSKCKKNAAWFIHPYTMPFLEQIQDASGRFIMRPYPLSGNEATLSGGPTYQMEGMPIIETEKAPLPGTTGDLTLADASSYLLGRRGGVEIGVSDQFLYDTDQIAIRCKLRNDGQPELLAAIPLADGTATVSCTVVLV
jgi:HK97 family phage major capsid protein